MFSSGTRSLPRRVPVSDGRLVRLFEALVRRLTLTSCVGGVGQLLEDVAPSAGQRVDASLWGRLTPIRGWLPHLPRATQHGRVCSQRRTPP